MLTTLDVLRDLLKAPDLWLESEAAGRRVDPSATDPKSAASRARREGKIFAAWDGERFHYPAFQFEPDGPPRARTAALIEVLPRDQNGAVSVDAALWSLVPDAALGSATPAEVFPTDPERVIALARSRKMGEGD